MKKPAEVNNDVVEQQPDVLDEAIAKHLKALGNPVPGDLNPCGRVADVARKVPDVHSVHRAKAAGIVNEFNRASVIALDSLDYVKVQRLIHDFWAAMWQGGLQTAPPEPTEFDRWRHKAGSLGVSLGELEALTLRLGYMTPRVKIEDITGDGATLSNGTVWTWSNKPQKASVEPPTVVIGGAVAGGSRVVYSDRAVFDATRGSDDNDK